MSEENYVNRKMQERIENLKELEEFIDGVPHEEFEEEFPEELCDCDCGISYGFDGDYNDLLTLLYQSNEAYINSKYEYEKNEAELWLETNFEEVLGPDCSYQDKCLYVKKLLLPFKLVKDTDKSRYDNFKRMYDLALKYSIEVLR